jgi:cysteine-rich repeat protein
LDCDDGNACNGAEACKDGLCWGGTNLTNGAACSLPGETGTFICMNGNCTTSRCGDLYVDGTAGEDCDDGNDVNGDGCDATCTFSCSVASDCDDGNVCNGSETCDATADGKGKICAVGVEAAPNTPCGTGMVCRVGGTCAAVGCGNNVVDPGEDCDDGNTTEGDGCDNDCTFSCTFNGDCIDQNVCNGTETCNTTTHICQAGTVLTCNDSNACTTDSCDPVKGCIYTLIDNDGDGYASSTLGKCGTDCNDKDPAIYPGAPELCDGKDNDCDLLIDEEAPFWYPDCDGDGFALLKSTPVQSCDKPTGPPLACPKGSVGAWTSLVPSETKYADCWDADAVVYPGVTSFYTTPIMNRLTLAVDYNCDGTQEQQYTSTGVSTLSKCLKDSLGFCLGGSQGWTGSTAPACGKAAEYTFCSLKTCGRVIETRTQACR